VITTVFPEGVMSHEHPQRVRVLVTLAALAAACAAGCADQGLPYDPPAQALEPDEPDDVLPDDPPPDPPGPGDLGCDSNPTCDSSLVVAAESPALLITDPDVLAALPLHKVLAHLGKLHAGGPPPTEMLQRLFDTMNATEGARFPDVHHCDDPINPALAHHVDAFTCPRAEGTLAFSDDLFVDGAPDSFFPIAVVNRIDLTPVDALLCGQYRIVYAKRSGLTDPNDRVFLIFEAAMTNPIPGCWSTCRDVGKFWYDLSGLPPSEMASKVSSFFFEGLPGHGPVLHPIHFGLKSQGAGYGGHEPGQIRISMHMEDPWIMREMRLDLAPGTGDLAFVPAAVKNNPPALLFNQAAATSVYAGFPNAFVLDGLPGLAHEELSKIGMALDPQTNGAESVLAGDKKNDYLAAATADGDTTFTQVVTESLGALTSALPQLVANCPAGDPLDAKAIFRRATALSCAGCHAPTDLIGEGRGIGCGLVWPDSIGQSHITETGELSPALKDVFLPHRAKVLTTFLQACDEGALLDVLQPVPGSSFDKQPMPGEKALVPTLGGSQVH
jgi:hypothetical protein